MLAIYMFFCWNPSCVLRFLFAFISYENTTYVLMRFSQKAYSSVAKECSCHVHFLRWVLIYHCLFHFILYRKTKYARYRFPDGQTDIIAIEHPAPNECNVDRHYVLEGAMKCFSGSSFNPKVRLNIKVSTKCYDNVAVI